MKSWYLMMGLLLALIFVGCDSTGKHDTKEFAEKENEQNFEAASDQKLADFVTQAIESNNAEIKLAELANTKSTSKKIQDFAQQMVSQHARTLAALQTVARKNNITIPVEESERTKKTLNALAEKEGEDFDKKWCDEMIDRHKKMIRASNKMVDRTSDPELTEIIKRSMLEAEAEVAQLQQLEKNQI
jgi:putative membrane protein